MSLQAQSSHQSLCTVLVTDMQRAIADSTGIQPEKQTVSFLGDPDVTEYLDDIMNQSHQFDTRAGKDSIRVQIKTLDLSLNKVTENSLRNTAYVRKLNLNVEFLVEDKMFQWQGNIADKVSNTQMKNLLPEWFPVPISGNYLDDQPGSLSIVLTTFTILSLVAALYFIRS